MTARPVEDLVDALSNGVRAVRPLPNPLRRALTTLGALALAGAAAIYLFGDVAPLFGRYSGRQALLAAEMAAMLATGALGVTAAFFAAVPGRSRGWLLAPLPPFAAWLLLSGMGCYRELVRSGSSGGELGHSADCLLFIAGASLLLGAPLLWLLSRARPIDPLPVALLAGVGTAALSAFVLLFFHPFAVTFVDLAMHLMAILLVMGAAALLRRKTLSPA
jgi:Negative regulator of sigma F